MKEPKKLSKAAARQSARDLVISLIQSFEGLGGLLEEPEEVQKATRELAWMILNPRVSVNCMPDDWSINHSKY